MRRIAFSVSALDPRPHKAPLLGAVGAGARHEHEGHSRRFRRAERFGRRDGDAVGDARVVGLRHPGRRHAQAEETRVEAAQLILDRRVLPQISRWDDFVKPGVLHARGVRPIVSTLLDVRSPSRHSQTPCPIMPVPPTRTTFISEVVCHSRAAHQPVRLVAWRAGRGRDPALPAREIRTSISLRAGCSVGRWPGLASRSRTPRS